MSVRVLICFFVFCLTGCHPPVAEIYENVRSVDWLPTQAHDIAYSRTNGMDGGDFIYECTLPKNVFQKFASQKSWTPLEKITYPTSINRYIYPTTSRKKFTSDGDYLMSVEKIVKKGWYFEKSSDHAIEKVVYDEISNRLYYYSTKF